MNKISKQGYTHVHPTWQAPSGKEYRIERYELKRRYVLFESENALLTHIESDVLLLHLLKKELGWSGNTQQPLTPKDRKNLRLLEQAFCLTYEGIFLK